MLESLFLAVRIGSTAFDAVVAILVLVRLARAGRASAASVAGGAAAAATAFVVKLPVWLALGLSRFGIVHLAYLDLVVLPTMLVVTVLWCERRRGAPWSRRWGAVPTAVLGACIAPSVAAYASFVEPFAVRLETCRVPVAAARRPAESLRIGVLADIQTAHVTEYEHRAIDRLMAERPDLILLPGDLFHGAPATFAGELGRLRALMAKLHAPGGVYFVLGDADTRGELAEIVEGTAIQVLVNRAHRVEVKGRTVAIGGIELDVDRPQAVRFLHAFEGAPGDDDLRLLLSHRPDVVLRLRTPTRVDLVVAGHTHGGQVQLPFFGPPLILSAVPRAVGAGGYHRLEGRPIYVSRGIGHEGGQAPRIRFLCPPEVSLLIVG
jgi:predicted MPP superfamily phosphohydrolase